VRTISFEFLDDRLISLWIGYNGSFKWQSMDEFLPDISKALNIPNTWEPKSWIGQEPQVQRLLRAGADDRGQSELCHRGYRGPGRARKESCRESFAGPEDLDVKSINHASSYSHYGLRLPACACGVRQN
jgi:hypothetical protein